MDTEIKIQERKEKEEGKGKGKWINTVNNLTQTWMFTDWVTCLEVYLIPSILHF